MVFGLFSKDRAIKRATKKVLNKLAQSAERWAAMEVLRDDGSEESLFILCKRLAFQSHKPIEDEQEKAWVVDTLVAKGETVLPALRRYMSSAQTIAYHLQILERIADPPQVLNVIDELLAKEEPGYTRDPTKRIQIIDWLGEWEAGDDREVLRRIQPYLADFDENVRFAAVNAYSLRPIDDAATALVEALLRPEEDSRRLMVRIADVIAGAGLDLCGRKKDISALTSDVLSEFRLRRDKLVRKS